MHFLFFFFFISCHGQMRCETACPENLVTFSHASRTKRLFIDCIKRAQASVSCQKRPFLALSPLQWPKGINCGLFFLFLWVILNAIEMIRHLPVSLRARRLGRGTIWYLQFHHLSLSDNFTVTLSCNEHLQPTMCVSMSTICEIDTKDSLQRWITS